MSGLGGVKEYAYNDPQNLVVARLRTNLHAFSAAKSLNKYRDFAEAMIDEKGNIKPFNQFRQDVAKINALYNEQWLRTEYETAIASAQAAAKWDEIQQNKNIAPYLVYRTMEDNKVSPEHAALNNLKAAVDNAIWNTIYPPIRWRCRCYTIQTSDANNITVNSVLAEKSKAANIQPMFRNNVGKTGVVFRKEHPMYKNLSGKLTELDAVKNYGMRNWAGIHKDMDAALPLPAPKSKANFNKWWDGMIERHGVENGTAFALPDKLGNTLLVNSQPSDTAYGWLTDKVLQQPDEVWSAYNILNTGKKLSHNYVKYFNGKTFAVQATEANGVIRVESFFEIRDAATFTDIRKGVLMHANKTF